MYDDAFGAVWVIIIVALTIGAVLDTFVLPWWKERRESRMVKHGQ